MKIYYSELLRTVNNATNKTTYYVKKCDIFSRISKAEYNQRYDDSSGVSNLHNTTSKKYNRFYTTITMYC